MKGISTNACRVTGRENTSGGNRRCKYSNVPRHGGVCGNGYAVHTTTTAIHDTLHRELPVRVMREHSHVLNQNFPLHIVIGRIPFSNGVST